VLFWYCLISLRATVPGLHLREGPCFLFAAPFVTFATLVAISLCIAGLFPEFGKFLLVDFRAVWCFLISFCGVDVFAEDVEG